MSVIREPSPITLTIVGEPSLAELQSAVSRAQSHDPFARVVVIADHFDAATALRHLLGRIRNDERDRADGPASRGGARGSRPAIARALKPLTWLLERQVVRAVAEDSVRRYGFDSRGGRLMRNSLAAAFRRMQEPVPADESR